MNVRKPSTDFDRAEKATSVEQVSPGFSMFWPRQIAIFLPDSAVSIHVYVRRLSIKNGYKCLVSSLISLCNTMFKSRLIYIMSFIVNWLSLWFEKQLNYEINNDNNYLSVPARQNSSGFDGFRCNERRRFFETSKWSEVFELEIVSNRFDLVRNENCSPGS